jgi:hypothetical protein
VCKGVTDLRTAPPAGHTRKKKRGDDATAFFYKHTPNVNRSNPINHHISKTLSLENQAKMLATTTTKQATKLGGGAFFFSPQQKKQTFPPHTRVIRG